MEVIATGKLTTFPGSSKYQIVIDGLEPAGAGALMALLEERKRRLAAEGLFDAARKQLLPFMPEHIGVVTSPTGAVIRDILHRVMDRFPCRVTVWPVRVQGETTGAEVSAAINGFNAMEGAARPDILVVARGGGSLEDLWGFNDEAIVRAVAASEIPVISAVGHETDWTLIDLAADVRAPTPTGAAEMAVPVKADLEAALASLGARLDGAMRRGLERRRQAATAAARGIPGADALLAIPRRRFDEAAETLRRALELNVARKRQRLAALRLTPASLSARLRDRAAELERIGRRLRGALPRRVEMEREALARAARRLDPALMMRRISERQPLAEALARRMAAALASRMDKQRARLAQAGRLLVSLSHHSVLARGFALVTDKAGTLVRQAEAAKAAGALVIEFSDGKVEAFTGAVPARKRGDAEPGPQGSLF